MTLKPDAKRRRAQQPLNPEQAAMDPDTSLLPDNSTLQPPNILKDETIKSTDNTSMNLAKSVIQHGSRFLQLKPTERHWITKIHHNLGHPSAQKLKLVLNQQGYAPEIIQGVDDFRCSTCHELQQPKISRPAVLPEDREFNDCVGCDLVTWTSPKTSKQYQFLHCIDAATNFQLAIPVFRNDAEALFDAWQDCWISWAGPCKQLVIDNASGLLL